MKYVNCKAFYLQIPFLEKDAEFDFQLMIYCWSQAYTVFKNCFLSYHLKIQNTTKPKIHAYKVIYTFRTVV